MLMSIVSFLVSVVAIFLLVKVAISVTKSLFKSVAIKVSKVMFFNTLLVSGSIAIVGPSIFYKNSDNVNIPLIFGIFACCFILFQLLGNNVNFEIGWTIVRTIYNIADGFLLGSLLAGLLQEKCFEVDKTLKMFICLAVTLFMFIATYLEKRKREREGV